MLGRIEDQTRSAVDEVVVGTSREHSGSAVREEKVLDEKERRELVELKTC